MTAQCLKDILHYHDNMSSDSQYPNKYGYSSMVVLKLHIPYRDVGVKEAKTLLKRNFR